VIRNQSTTRSSNFSSQTTYENVHFMASGPADSKEDDLEKTIKLIMEHVEKEAKKEEMKRMQQAAHESKAEKQRVVNLPSLIKADNEIMLRSKKAANDVLGIKNDEENEHLEELVSVTNDSKNLLDRVMSTATNLFPFFVLSFAIIGLKKPNTLLWVNRGQLIPLMLSAVMMAMGMTLKTEDFTRVLSIKASNEQETTITAIPVGIICQYVIMPLTAFLIGSATLLPQNPAAFLGLVLVGCSPGGTASNLVSLIAKADVALSVILTSFSTIMASVLTPVLAKTLVGSAVSISGWVLCKATAQVVLVPVALGMIIREKLPKIADFVGRFASFAGVLLVSLLCGGVVAQNAGMAVAGSSNILSTIVFSVLGLHGVGFALGYLASKKLFGLSEKVSRTICIETGMQNSALAVVLARSVIGNDPALASIVSLACLPGAFSATVHSCLGSALAVFWRWQDRQCNISKATE